MHTRTWPKQDFQRLIKKQQPCWKWCSWDTALKGISYVLIVKFVVGNMEFYDHTHACCFHQRLNKKTHSTFFFVS